jgi:hypothetical protein
MNALNLLVNLIAAMLSHVLIGFSAAALHAVAVVSLLIIAAGVAIVSPGVFLVLLLIVVLLYASGSIR